VGVVAAWKHPGTKQIELTPSTIAEIRRVVGAEEWRAYFTAERWVGKAVAQVMGLDHETDAIVIKQVIKTLLARGVLKEVQGKRGNRAATTLVVPGDAAQGFDPVQPSAGENTKEMPV
jgi:hypothetical protein